MISKEVFVEVINEIAVVDKYHENLNSFFKSNDVDGYIFQPDCSPAILKLLRIIFNDEDDWIDYFCNELEYGKKWKAGMIQDNDGQDIDLSTSEKLYDFLTSSR